MNNFTANFACKIGGNWKLPNLGFKIITANFTQASKEYWLQKKTSALDMLKYTESESMFKQV